MSTPEGPPEAATPPLLTEARAQMLSMRATEVFKPAAPITRADLFAGRLPQLERTIDAINQPGRHVVVYGSRGVGKTSMANVLAEILQGFGMEVHATKVNCTKGSTFASLLQTALRELYAIQTERVVGFETGERRRSTSLAERLPDNVTPQAIYNELRAFAHVVLIFDEFDRLASNEGQAFADLLKMLSDNSVDTTVIIVGVADTIDSLIANHQSVERAISQILMPRMARHEMTDILLKGASKLEVSFDTSSSNMIVEISQGLPPYTHLLGLHAVRSALARRDTRVTADDVRQGIKSALRDSEHSIQSQYVQATQSVQPGALFEQALLACALAAKDELGFFQMRDVVEPMTAIMGRRYDIPNLQGHITAFAGEDRMKVLERSGGSRRYRYRFSNPLLQPYVTMRGIDGGMLDADRLSELTSGY